VYTGTVIQAISWRVGCAGPAPSISAAPQASASSARSARKGQRRAYFGDAGGWMEAPVYDRYALAAGQRIDGPALVEERESTTVGPPGDQLEVDGQGTLRIPIQQASPPAAGAPGSLDEAVSRLEADPIGLEIMWSRLINLVEECWLTVWRTAFSLIIGEAQDFACEILDARGNSLAHSPRAMPVFNLTLPLAVRAILEKVPVPTPRPPP